MSATVRLRYTGVANDPLSAAYALGCGYRLYVPSLMRFSAPDGSSPFERGGINPCSYCGADPINRSDPSGHFFMPIGIAIGASAAIALKYAGSMLARKFGGRIKNWIDGLPEDGNIGAREAAQAAHLASGSAELPNAAGSESEREHFTSTGEDLRSAMQNRVDLGGSRPIRTSRVVKLKGTFADRLDRVDDGLAAAERHREAARLLQRGAATSHQPALVREMAWDEREEGISILNSVGELIDSLAIVRDGLNAKLQPRFDTVDSRYRTLVDDYANLFGANRPRAL